MFKYVNKGHDRVTVAFYQNSSDNVECQIHDEIKLYYDWKYLSPCKAIWRIFSFNINHRNPLVERLSFHLSNEQSIVFCENKSIENIVSHTTLKKIKFLVWLDENNKYHVARNMTYAVIP